MPHLILASASPRRLDLLRQIGVTPDAVIPAETDETPQPSELAKPYALRVACAKMQALAGRYPQSHVLAADTVVALGRRILPKAEDEATARYCLQMLSGRRHCVLTAFVLHRPSKPPVIRCAQSVVRFKRLSEADMEWYLATKEWHGKAGGYAIQGAAQALIMQMQGSYSAIVGLPLLQVRHVLMAEGFTTQSAEVNASP